MLGGRYSQDSDVPENLRQAISYLRDLDRIIHEPSKQEIMRLLRKYSALEYNSLHRSTGLSKGNLSNHLAKLQDAGYVNVDKRFENKKPMTTVCLTDEGREAIEQYFERMTFIARNT